MSVRTNGTTSGLTAPGSTAYGNLGKGTICMWVKPLSYPNSQPAMFVKAPASVYTDVCWINLSGQMGVEIKYNPSGPATSDSITDLLTLGTWFHYTMSFDIVDGGPLKLYRNGAEITYAAEATVPTGQTPKNDTAGFAYIGNDGGTNQYDGELSDLRIYNTVLSDSQIASVALGGTPSSNNLVGWWKFCGDNLTLDSSGNGNTLSNGDTGNGTLLTPCPAGATQPPVDICSLTAGSVNVSGSVSFSNILIQMTPTRVDSSKTQTLFTISDANGNYSFTVPVGEYIIEATDPANVRVYLRRAYVVVSNTNLSNINFTPALINASNS